MEHFEVKILQRRRRLGIKEISAPSIEIAESYIIQLLKQYLNLETVSGKPLYIHRSTFERIFKLQICNYNFSITLNLLLLKESNQ